MFNMVAFTMYPVHHVARARAFYEQAPGLALGSESNSLLLHQLDWADN